MRCKHENISIIEVGTSFTYHDREKDGVWTHHNDFGDYTGTVYVKCFQCGFHKTFYYRNRPKWLMERLKEIDA